MAAIKVVIMVNIQLPTYSQAYGGPLVPYAPMSWQPRSFTGVAWHYVIGVRGLAGS